MQLLAWENIITLFQFSRSEYSTPINIMDYQQGLLCDFFFFYLKCIPHFLIVQFVWPIFYVHLTLLGSLVIIFQLPNGEDSLEEANKSKVVRQLFSIWGLVPQHTRLLYHYLTIVHFILNSSPS